jgi:hypothetical protein
MRGARANPIIRAGRIRRRKSEPEASATEVGAGSVSDGSRSRKRQRRKSEPEASATAGPSRNHQATDKVRSRGSCWYRDCRGRVVDQIRGSDRRTGPAGRKSLLFKRGWAGPETGPPGTNGTLRFKRRCLLCALTRRVRATRVAPDGERVQSSRSSSGVTLYRAMRSRACQTWAYC